MKKNIILHSPGISRLSFLILKKSLHADLNTFSLLWQFTLLSRLIFISSLPVQESVYLLPHTLIFPDGIAAFPDIFDLILEDVLF